jgi:hypothetical protein
VHEQAPVGLEARMEGQAQQAALRAGHQPIRQVDERRFAKLASGADDADPPAALVDEQASASVIRRRDPDRFGEPACDQLQPQPIRPGG